MILIDANAFIYICDKGQDKHLQFLKSVESITTDIVSTYPCLTEAMYFMGKLYGWHGQQLLWDFLSKNTIGLYQLSPDDLERMKNLMKKYSDVPMDFADASLVAAAEALATNKILTSDSDFYVYRINGRKHFNIVP